jgi:hypothetical protein
MRNGSCLKELLIILAIIGVPFILGLPFMVQQIRWENQQAQAKELAAEQAKASMTKEELQEARMEEGRIAAEKMDNFSFVLICILSIMNFYIVVSNNLRLLLAYLVIAGVLWAGYGWQAVGVSFIVSWFISLAFYSLVRSAVK